MGGGRRGTNRCRGPRRSAEQLRPGKQSSRVKRLCSAEHNQESRPTLNFVSRHIARIWCAASCPGCVSDSQQKMPVMRSRGLRVAPRECCDRIPRFAECEACKCEVAIDAQAHHRRRPLRWRGSAAGGDGCLQGTESAKHCLAWPGSAQIRREGRRGRHMLVHRPPGQQHQCQEGPGCARPETNPDIQLPALLPPVQPVPVRHGTQTTTEGLRRGMPLHQAIFPTILP